MRIEEIVNGVVDECVLDKMDLTIEHLAYMFDVHILYNHKSNFYIQKSDVDVIGIRFNNRYEMFKNFCHEAGHMFLHHTNYGRMPDSFNRMQESEADKFAMLLMMPEKLIIENKLYDTAKLMAFFSVSEQEAMQRLEMLANYSRVAQLQF